MSPEQLRSDIATIRSVLAEGAASHGPHRAILAGANLCCGLFLLLAVPVLLVAFGLPAYIASTQEGESGTLGSATLIMVGAGLIAVILVTATPFFLAGWGLLTKQTWAPTVAIVAAILNLMNLPLGTAIAIYTFWAVAKGKLVNIDR